MIRYLVADLLFLGGLISTGYGAYMLNPAFAYIICGILIMLLSFFLSGTKSSTRGQQ